MGYPQCLVKKNIADAFTTQDARALSSIVLTYISHNSPSQHNNRLNMFMFDIHKYSSLYTHGPIRSIDVPADGLAPLWARPCADYRVRPLQWRHNERDGVSNHQSSIVYSIVCSGADQRKHQRSASLAFGRGIHRWPVNSHNSATSAQ